MPSSTRLPRHARVVGHGQCQVLGYQGNGYFLVETPRGSRVQVHRSRLIWAWQSGKKVA